MTTARYPSVRTIALHYLNHQKENVHKLLGEPFAVGLTYIFLRFSSITPRTVTRLSLFFGIAAAVAIIGHREMWSAILFYICHVLDTVDGKIARFRGTGSPQGQLLDFGVDTTVMMALGTAYAYLWYTQDDIVKLALLAGYLILFYTIDRFELSWQRYLMQSESLSIGHSVGDQVKKDWIRSFFNWRVWRPRRSTTLWLVFVFAPVFDYYSPLYVLSIGILLTILIRPRYLPTVAGE